MISLKKLWSAEPPSGNDDPLRVIRLLLQGIALHAVEGDREDHEKFRLDMEALLDAVGANPSTAVLLVTTGSALKALENYNQSTTRYLRMQGAELQNMIGMLTKTVATLGSGSDRSVTRLREIESQLERASEIQDVRMLKLRMEQCLESIREEAQKQKIESSRIVEGLQNDILQTQERIRPASVSLPDPVTGLPPRADAETALAEAVAGAKSFVVLLAVDRVELINGRFGFAAGDEVLKLYLEALRTRPPRTGSFAGVGRRSSSCWSVRIDWRTCAINSGPWYPSRWKRLSTLPIGRRWSPSPPPGPCFP